MNFLTHYYKKGDQPFRSISELSKIEALRHISQYDPEEALVYRRFHNPEKYLEERNATEIWLYEEFKNKGGRPEKLFPYYLVLGESDYIFKGYNENCNIISIPIEQIDESKISFTYPDSMVSYWLKDQKSSEKYFQSKYHGVVFTLDEIFDLLREVEHFERVWEDEETRAFDFFVEAQLWTESPILGFLK